MSDRPRVVRMIARLNVGGPALHAAFLSAGLADRYDTLLVMTVEPGFGGQVFMADMLDKVRRARAMVDTGHLNVIVQVDGGINADTIAQAAEAGANCFVAGSAVYGAADPAVAVAHLRDLAAAQVTSSPSHGRRSASMGEDGQ